MPQDQRPFSEYGQAVAATFDEPPVQANGVVVGVSVDPETFMPGLMFQFVDEGDKPVAAVFLRGLQPMLPGIVIDAVAAMDRLSKDPEAVRELILRFLETVGESIEAAAYPDTMAMAKDLSAVASCRSCGRQIYGEIAARGACLACEPELPPGGLVV